MAAEAAVAEIGVPAPDFELLGTDGGKHRLRDLAGEHGTVVAFICNHCPYVKAILPRRRCADHSMRIARKSLTLV